MQNTNPQRHDDSKDSAPFNYTSALEGVVRDIVETLEVFDHIDLNRILLATSIARQSSKHGTYATCVALRFENGASTTISGNRCYQMPPMIYQGREILYVIYFTLPRFHDQQNYREKIATIIHELYHIGQAFDGDIRRFPGKNFAHGHSREEYHSRMRELADRYLRSSDQATEHAFLHRPFSELLAQPGGMVGRKVSRPRPVEVPYPVKTRR